MQPDNCSTQQTCQYQICINHSESIKCSKSISNNKKSPPPQRHQYRWRSHQKMAVLRCTWYNCIIPFPRSRTRCSRWFLTLAGFRPNLQKMISVRLAKFCRHLPPLLRLRLRLRLHLLMPNPQNAHPLSQCNHYHRRHCPVALPFVLFLSFFAIRTRKTVCQYQKMQIGCIVKLHKVNT